MAILIEVSKKRDLLELNQHLNKMSKCNEKVMVRHTCRKKFTDPHNRSSSDAVPMKKLRLSSESSKFDWKKYSFIYLEKVDFLHVKRDLVLAVTTLPLRENIIQLGHNRNDEWGRSVLGRLLT